MKQFKHFFCILLAVLTAQTAFGQDETREIFSHFTKWQLLETTETGIRGTLDTKDGYRWSLSFNDPQAFIDPTSRWGEESDAVECAKFGNDAKKSVVFNLRSLFMISGIVKKVTVKATGYFKDMTISLDENDNPSAETSQKIKESNQYDAPTWFGFQDYVFDFSDEIDYTDAVLVLSVEGPTPTYILSITIELAGEEKGGKTGDLSWKVEKIEGEPYITYYDYMEKKEAPPYCLTISGSGDMPDYTDYNGVSTAPWTKFPTIKKVIVRNGVSSIGSEAFYHFGNVSEVTLPQFGLKKIGGHAFNGTAITEINLPEGIETIRFFAFYGTQLENVTIPSSVKSMEHSVFMGPNLKSISVGEDNTVYDSRNNCNAIIRTSTNELIGGCMNTVIPDDVAKIGMNAFYNCSNLKKLVVPNSVTTLGRSAIASCSDLEELVLGSGLTSIASDAFYNLNKLDVVVCTADPENLTWEDCNSKTCCKKDGTTQFHVMNPAAWQAKFPDAHVQFVAIGGAETVEGDVSGDGKTDVEDVLALMKYIAGMAAGISATAADVNKDGKVDVADVVALINLILGK